MSFNPVDFHVLPKGNYLNSRKIQFSVKELGLHGCSEDMVDIETWSKTSGHAIPEDFELPFINPPRSLPLSLKLKRWTGERVYMYLDVTNYEHLGRYKVKLPPKPMPEFIPEFFSIGKLLTWAMREQTDVSQIDFFVQSAVLRDIASAQFHELSSPWKCAVFNFKGRIFIDRSVHDDERYWMKGLDERPQNYGKCIKTPHPLFTLKLWGIKPKRFHLNSIGKDIHYSQKFLTHQDLIKYGKKFEDVMKCGGPGDPDYSGERDELKCFKLISLCNHKIATVARKVCHDIDPISNQIIHIELKTIFPQKYETYARISSIKALKLWIHCYLVGVETVYCGFRDLDGTLIEVKKYTMDYLADIGKNYWTPNEVLGFLDSFLSWLKEKLNSNAVRRMYSSKECLSRAELESDVGETFTLSHDGDGCIQLYKECHPELRKIISERYVHVANSDQVIYSEHNDFDKIPDSWDSSDDSDSSYSSCVSSFDC